MRANLNMDNFKVINVSPGTGNTDAATAGQLINAATFDNGTRLLTLSAPLQPDVTVTIPGGSGGGGEGTVTLVDTGAGLEGGPITTAGTISLETIGTGQTYTGGISTITLDDHGRVTQVVEGAFANTNLSHTSTVFNVTIESSTGTDTTIPYATESQAGVMQAGYVSMLAGMHGNAFTIQYNATSVLLENSYADWDDVTILEADETNAGVMSAADKAKLNTFPADGSGLITQTEGTFTPEFSDSSGGSLGTTNYFNQKGIWEKVGDWVTISVWLNVQTFTDGGAEDDLHIGDAGGVNGALPFAPDPAWVETAAAVMYVTDWNLATSTPFHIQGRLEQNSNSAWVIGLYTAFDREGVGTIPQQYGGATSAISDLSKIRLQIKYKAA